MRLMSKLADRVLRSAEREDEMDKERRLSRSVQDELLKVTSRIANIKQTQSECEVKEKELQEEMESEKNRRETARRKIRVVTEIRNDWHHKNRQRDVINTGYRSQVMMLNVQKAKLQRQIEENSDNGKERIERSILEHADIRSLERELYSSEKENERLEEKLRTIDGKVDKEEQKIMHMADKVKREVNQACVQAIAEENRLVILRTELVPLAAKRMDILSIIEDVRTNAEIARQLHEKEKKSLLSRIKSEESANDEIMRRIQGKSSMNDVVLDLEEVQKEKMDIQKSIDNVNDVNISLQKEIHELEEILVEGTANLAKYNAETESMIFEIEEKRSEIDILTSKISNATVRAGRFDTWKQHESIQNSRLQNKIFEIENTKRRLYSLEKEDEHVKNRLKKRIRDLSETIKKDTEKCVLQQQIAANLHERYEELYVFNDFSRIIFFPSPFSLSLSIFSCASFRLSHTTNPPNSYRYESLQIVTRRYEKTHKMVREVNEEISRRKSKFERKRLIRAEATQELKDKIAENDMKIVNLQDQKRAENEEVRGIQDAVDSVLEDAKQVDLELNDKIMELTDRERELSQMLRHIIARNGILESEVSNTMSRSTKSHKLEVEVKDRASNVTQSVKKESFHLEQRIKTEIGKIDHLRSDIHALNNRRNEIHMEFEKLDYIRRQISSHYRSLKDSDSNATLHLEDIKEDEIDLQGRVETLEQQHGFIRKHVHDKIQSLGKARSNLITKKSHLKALKDNLSECELWHGNTLLNLERQRLKIRALTKEIKDQAEQYEQDAAVVGYVGRLLHCCRTSLSLSLSLSYTHTHTHKLKTKNRCVLN